MMPLLSLAGVAVVLAGSAAAAYTLSTATGTGYGQTANPVSHVAGAAFDCIAIVWLQNHRLLKGRRGDPSLAPPRASRRDPVELLWRHPSKVRRSEVVATTLARTKDNEFISEHLSLSLFGVDASIAALENLRAVLAQIVAMWVEDVASAFCHNGVMNANGLKSPVSTAQTAGGSAALTELLAVQIA